MKLYKLPRNTFFKIVGDTDETFLFDHVDGMYSYCIGEDGRLVHIAAYTDVTIVETKLEN